MKSAIGAMTFVAAAALMTGSSMADDTTPEQLVDGLNAVFGKHGERASHAKGLCVKGDFKPSADAAGLSKAPAFAGTVPVIGRFSMGGGKPNVPDSAKAAPRGFAFRLEDKGGNTDFVTVSTPMFFAKTPAQMLGFLQARVPAADGKPDPAKVKAFAEANPETAKQGAWLGSHPVPASYAGVNYWAIHAYTLTNVSGASHTVKFKLVPAAGDLNLTDEEASAKPADFYKAELQERLAKGTIDFTLTAIIAEAGDPANDPTAMWPEETRKSVALGTVSISALSDDAACDGTVFDPANLADGISGPADDPIFAARSPAYAISLSRRQK